MASNARLDVAVDNDEKVTTVNMQLMHTGNVDSS